MHLPAEVCRNPHLSELIVRSAQANGLFMRLKHSLKGSEQVQFSAPFLSQELKGLCVNEILSGICRHTQGPAAVDSGLRTDSGRFSASRGEHVGFQGNCTLGGLLAQCYRGNHEEHWSLFAFMGSAHSETVQDKEGAKCACKTYTCQRHLLCPAALLSGHSKYSLQTIPNCFHSSDASAYQESKAAI